MLKVCWGWSSPGQAPFFYRCRRNAGLYGPHGLSRCGLCLGPYLSEKLSVFPSQLHRMRRAPMSMFFSKASVRRLEPLVCNAVDKLTNAMQTHKNSGQPVVLNSAYSAYSIDIISEYCFANSFNMLDDHSFRTSMNEAFSKSRSGLHWTAHFPWLFQILRRLPR